MSEEKEQTLIGWEFDTQCDEISYMMVFGNLRILACYANRIDAENIINEIADDISNPEENFYDFVYSSAIKRLVDYINETLDMKLETINSDDSYGILVIFKRLDTDNQAEIDKVLEEYEKSPLYKFEQSVGKKSIDIVFGKPDVVYE
jgi:hypothetical protein